MYILPQYLANQTKPTRHIERCDLMAVVPTVTALLLSSLKDLQYFFVLLYALLEFRGKALYVNVPVAIFFLTVDCRYSISHEKPSVQNVKWDLAKSGNRV